MESRSTKTTQHAAARGLQASLEAESWSVVSKRSHLDIPIIFHLDIDVSSFHHFIIIPSIWSFRLRIFRIDTQSLTLSFLNDTLACLSTFVYLHRIAQPTQQQTTYARFFSLCNILHRNDRHSLDPFTTTFHPRLVYIGLATSTSQLPALPRSKPWFDVQLLRSTDNSREDHRQDLKKRKGRCHRHRLYHTITFGATNYQE